ncbi:tetratricopeptide repeat protein [Malonomonas rubra]|uniref:tetratricopeptide repeat protein n=1 Tax=Malonomonas rubra TaxID=57040 RepID=UPI0026F1BD68|nr:hypothetical protein [Malonomonas rubra]
MNKDDLDDTIKKGIAAAEKGDIHSALMLFNEAVEKRNTPEVHSYHAYCLAQSEGRFSAAAKRCRESIKREPGNSLHYLLLGRILLLAGEKRIAVKTFRQGLKASPNPKIIVELKKLGLRKDPPFKNLGRSHLLNRTFGKLLSSIGIR